MVRALRWCVGVHSASRLLKLPSYNSSMLDIDVSYLIAVCVGIIWYLLPATSSFDKSSCVPGQADIHAVLLGISVRFYYHM